MEERRPLETSWNPPGHRSQSEGEMSAWRSDDRDLAGSRGAASQFEERKRSNNASTTCAQIDCFFSTDGSGLDGATPNVSQKYI